MPKALYILDRANISTPFYNLRTHKLYIGVMTLRFMTRRTWIKFDIEKTKKDLFKAKCLKKGFDMSTWIKAKIDEFLLKGEPNE